MGHARLGLIKINLPPITVFTKLANGVSHKQINTVSETEHSAMVRPCTEILVKGVNMHKFQEIFHDCLLNI